MSDFVEHRFRMAFILSTENTLELTLIFKRGFLKDENYSSKYGAPFVFFGWLSRSWISMLTTQWGKRHCKAGRQPGTYSASIALG